jgi:Zn-dependent protease with chaperone function
MKCGQRLFAWKTAAILIVSAAAIFLAGMDCAAASVSDDVAQSDATPQEIKLSERVAAEIEKQWTVLVNPVYQARVETIVGRLAPQMERMLNYDVSVIDHKMVNAFALAGGKIYVTTGMLEFVKTDLELAGVLAHEMVHADKKHVLIQSARNNRMTLLAIAAAIASRGNGAAMIAANVLHVAVMGAYSIDLEKEADSLGIAALTRAGYNPVGVLTIQERLKEERLKRPEINPGIYQTHPEVDERIDAAEKYMEEHGIPIHRKYAIGSLRMGVTSDGAPSPLALTIDGEPVWRGRDNERTRELFRRVASDLWEYLQLETIPYDIAVTADGNGERAFFAEGRRIVSEGDLPEGTEGLSELREGVHKALTKARSSHPMADYYKF